MNRFRLMIIVMSAFICSVTVLSAELWVSTSGSDTTGTGAPLSPFATISRALDDAVPGDTITVREGVYEEAVRVRNADITIQAESGADVRIEVPADDPDYEVAVILDVDSNGSILRGLEIAGGYYYGVMTYTRWDWGEPDRSGASDITIEDCTIHNTGRDCIKITPGCDDILIRNCEIYNSGVRDDSNAEGIDVVNGDRVTVQDCWIHDTATTGIYLKGGSIDGIVERCLVERCGSLGIVLGFDTSPEYFDLDVNPNRYENINGVVRNCIVQETTYGGIAMYGAFEPTVVNNTIINTARSGHAPIYFGTPLQDWVPDEDPDDGIGYRTPTVDPDIRNNIVWQKDGWGTMAVSIRTFYHESLGRVNGLEGMPHMDHNLYFVADGPSARFTDDRPDSLLDQGTLPDWRTHIGDAEHSLEGDPMLSDTAEPVSGSPCIDVGATDVPVVVDFQGRYRVPPYDIGALEAANLPSDTPVRFVPHIAQRNYTTKLVLIQPNQEPAEVRVTVRDAFGIVLASQDLELGGFETRQLNLSELGGPDGAGAEVYFLSGSPVVRVNYRNFAGGMADFLVGEEIGRRLMFALASDELLTWHGIAIRNTSDEMIGITLHAYAADGSYLGFENFDLHVRGQRAGLLGSGGDWFAGIPLSDIALVVASISNGGNDARINGLTISGAGQERLLFTPAVVLSSQ